MQTQLGHGGRAACLLLTLQLAFLLLTLPSTAAGGLCFSLPPGPQDPSLIRNVAYETPISSAPRAHAPKEWPCRVVAPIHHVSDVGVAHRRLPCILYKGN